MSSYDFLYGNVQGGNAHGSNVYSNFNPLEQDVIHRQSTLQGRYESLVPQVDKVPVQLPQSWGGDTLQVSALRGRQYSMPSIGAPVNLTREEREQWLLEKELEASYVETTEEERRQFEAVAGNLVERMKSVVLQRSMRRDWNKGVEDFPDYEQTDGKTETVNMNRIRPKPTNRVPQPDHEMLLDSHPMRLLLKQSEFAKMVPYLEVTQVVRNITRTLEPYRINVALSKRALSRVATAEVIKDLLDKCSARFQMLRSGQNGQHIAVFFADHSDVHADYQPMMDKILVVNVDIQILDLEPKALTDDYKMAIEGCPFSFEAFPKEEFPDKHVFWKILGYNYEIISKHESVKIQNQIAESKE